MNIKHNEETTNNTNHEEDLMQKKESYENDGIRVDWLRICHGLPMTN